jgi:hypothetical protein
MRGALAVGRRSPAPQRNEPTLNVPERLPRLARQANVLHGENYEVVHAR